MNDNNTIDSSVVLTTTTGGQSSEFTGNPQTQNGVAPTPVTEDAQPIVNNTQPAQTPGPDVAFAQMRRELEQYKSIATDQEVQKFLAERKAQQEAARAQQLGATPELIRELDELKQFRTQQQTQAFQNEIIQNEERTKAAFNMDDATFSQFTDFLQVKYPEVGAMLRVNPSFDLEPFIAAWNPQAYAAGKAGTSVPHQPARAVYIPGHGVGPALNAAQDVKAIEERIRSVASQGLEHLRKK